MSPLLALFVAQGINMVLKAVSNGKFTIPDATPIVNALLGALGHLTGETEDERAVRRADAEAIFAKHGESLLPPVVTP